MFGRSLSAVFVALVCELYAVAGGSPDTTAWQQALERGRQLWFRGDLSAAETVLEGALRQAQSNGRDELAVAMTLNGLASVYQDEGRYRDAEQSYRRSILTLEKNLGRDDKALASPLHNLADLYLETGRYKDAEPLLLRSLSIRMTALGANDPEVATTLNNLGSLYRLQRRWQEAERPLKEALALFKKKLGPFDIRVAEVVSNLGRLYQDTHRYSEAMACFKEVLAIVDKAAASPAFVAKALNNQGALYAAMGKPVEAEPYLKKALSVEEQALGPDHPAVAGILSNYASVLRQTKRKSEAKHLENRARAILSKNAPSLRTGYTVDASELPAANPNR